MVVANKKKANLGIGISLLLGFLMIGYLVMTASKTGTPPQPNPLISILGYVSTGSMVWGLYNYAKGKGYSGFLAILGFLSLIGWIILVLLPDKRKNG